MRARSSINAVMKVLFILVSCCLLTSLKQVSSRSYLSEGETHIYNQLEDALDAGTLDNLRNVFSQAKLIAFPVNITVDSIPPVNCTVAELYSPQEVSFCKQNYSEIWTVCYRLKINWAPTTYLLHNFWLIDLVFLYGNTLSLLIFYSDYSPRDILTAIEPTKLKSIFFPDPSLPTSSTFSDSPVISLKVKSLNCNPSPKQLANAVGELFTWIKLYAESGGKPQTYTQQGHTTVGDDYFVSYGPEWTINYGVSIITMFVAYFLLSFSLTLLIPRLLAPQYGRIIVNRSIYWGSSVVCVFLASLLLFSKFIVAHIIGMQMYFGELVIILPLQLGFVIPVSIIGAIIVSRNITIPIPSFQFTANVIFCCWPCFCCSKKCKSRGIHALVVWSTITVIYHSIVETIALLCLMFVNIALTVSHIVLYISCVFFLTMLMSQIFNLLSSDETSRASKRLVRCLLAITDVCSMTCSLGVVICIVIMYIVIATSDFQFEGVKGFIVSLIPSAALSAAGWYIKYKMFKKHRQGIQPPSGYGAIAEQDV